MAYRLDIKRILSMNFFHAGESAAAVDLLLGVVAAVKVVTPMSHE